jgi:DNA-binding PadR family transcriptional regulator
MSKNQLDLGRFAEPALLILISLAEQPRHGYAMMEDIAAFAGVRLGPGTMYGAIARLEKQDFIEAVPSTDRRQPYRLTAAGLAALQEQLDNINAVATAGMRRVRHSGQEQS